MADWPRLCRGTRNVAVESDAVTVTLDDGRTQRIRVKETPETLELTSVVVRPTALREHDDAALRAWRRNRSSQLVGFSIDRRLGLVATGWVPRVGLTAEEFVGVLHRLATAADLFEYQLTGKDKE